MTGAFPGHAQSSVTFACHLLKLTKVVVSLSIWATYHFSIMGTICTHAISSRITFRVWWTYKSPANHSGDIHSFWKRKEIKRIILASITLLIIDPSNILTRARLVEARHETEYVTARIGEYLSDFLKRDKLLGTVLILILLLCEGLCLNSERSCGFFLWSYKDRAIFWFACISL